MHNTCCPFDNVFSLRPTARTCPPDFFSRTPQPLLNLSLLSCSLFEGATHTSQRLLREITLLLGSRHLAFRQILQRLTQTRSLLPEGHLMAFEVGCLLIEPDRSLSVPSPDNACKQRKLGQIASIRLRFSLDRAQASKLLHNVPLMIVIERLSAEHTSVAGQ